MITLQEMDAETFAVFIPHLLEGYSRDLAENIGLSQQEAREKAAAQVNELLPQGLETPGHLFFIICQRAEDTAPVGWLWVFVDDIKHKAFIYDIEIAEGMRGKGLGRAALLAMEEHLRPMQVRAVELNVFGSNPSARHLYESMGYQPFSINMRKEL